MKRILTLPFLLFCFIALAQDTSVYESTSYPVTIKWVNRLHGNFSFRKNWDYPIGVEKKANQELQQMDSIKNQFLLTTQHDLRKPLTSVKWFLELLMGGALGKQNKKP